MAHSVNGFLVHGGPRSTAVLRLVVQRYFEGCEKVDEFLIGFEQKFVCYFGKSSKDTTWGASHSRDESRCGTHANDGTE